MSSASSSASASWSRPSSPDGQLTDVTRCSHCRDAISYIEWRGLWNMMFAESETCPAGDITAFDCHAAANAGTKRARHPTARLVPTDHKRPATHPSTGCYWRSNLVGPSGTLAASAMPGHAFRPRCTLPGLRGRVGDPATGDARQTFLSRYNGTTLRSFPP
jgi:hypothetical protein